MRAGRRLVSVPPRLGARSFLARVGAAAATLPCVLALSAPAGAAPAAPFRAVVHMTSGRLDVGSDGVRFAWATNLRVEGFVRVFDTLRGRSFRLTAPTPGCQVSALGGGVVRWQCPSPRQTLITYLASGRTREPAGIERVRAMNDQYTSCQPAGRIGRSWTQVWCWSTSGGGGGPDPCCFLNHRTGELLTSPPAELDDPSLDLDYAGLVRSLCAPLGRATEVRDYLAPFALQMPELWVNSRLVGVRSIRLWRCGTIAPNFSAVAGSGPVERLSSAVAM
jgi:hypothetical protein